VLMMAMASGGGTGGGGGDGDQGGGSGKDDPKTTTPKPSPSSASREYFDLDEAASAALGEEATVTGRYGDIGPIKNEGVIADLERLGYDPAEFRAVQYEVTGEKGSYIITVFESEGGVYYGPHVSSANY
jgi:hypothetical protein